MSLEQITKLREMTGAGMMDCKNALDEASGDLDKAAEILRKKGIVKAAKRADKIAAEGTTLVKTEGNTAVVAEVNCETDFVAKNENFQAMVDVLVSHLLKVKPASLEEGLQSKMENGQSVEEFITEHSGKIGEKITLRRFEMVSKEDGEVFGAYLHAGGKISTLTLLKGTDNEELARDVAMHAAAANPKCLSRDEVSQADINKEAEIYREQLKAEGKPENIIDNIIKGKMNKYYSENCLLEQPFIKDEDKTVAQYIKEQSGDTAELVKYVRYELGEGIDKKEIDYVKEVQEQLG